MAIAVAGRNIWRGITGNSRRKTGGARAEARNARHGAATKRKNVPMVRARQDPMKSQEAADRPVMQNHLTGAGPEGVGHPQKGARAKNRDAPCGLSAAG